MVRLTRGVRAFFFSAFAPIASPALTDDGFQMLVGHGGPIMGLVSDNAGVDRLSASFQLLHRILARGCLLMMQMIGFCQVVWIRPLWFGRQTIG